MKKILFLIILFLIIYSLLNKDIEVIKVDLPPPQNYEVFLASEDIKEEIIPIIKEKIEKKEELNLNIPFTSQAPSANWDQPYQDACEEAVLLMVDYYYQEKELPFPEEREKIIKEMVSWQEENWGGHFNLPISKLKEFGEEYFNYQIEIIFDLNTEKIKYYLDQGLPIIVPVNGQELNNPYFNNGGPEYHMLVIKGYLDNKFITNDPGTKRGEDFIYTTDNLLNSIADWDTKKSHTDMGLKIGLIILKN